MKNTFFDGRSKNIIFNLAALGFGIFIVLAMLFSLETFLRFKYKDAAKFYYSLDPGLLNHAALFRRSPVPSVMDSGPRVFCLGGSTTNGCSMPIQYSYPNLLESIFKKEALNGTAYNFGISGVNSIVTNFFTKTILPQYDPGCIVLHDGYNDLPIVIKKLGADSYEYIKPDYLKPYNPYIANPVLRYLSSFIKFNLRSTRRYVITFVKDRMKKGGDLFLGFDYTRYKKYNGASKDIFVENKKRAEIMIKTELDTIDYCMKNNIKVIVILEPYIKPMHFLPAYGSGFRDEKVGEILYECHKAQQTAYKMVLYNKYKDNKNVMVLDMREIFKDKYDELFYDECHLNGKGNFIKARYVHAAVRKLFPVKKDEEEMGKLISQGIDLIDEANSLGK